MRAFSCSVRLTLIDVNLSWLGCGGNLGGDEVMASMNLSNLVSMAINLSSIDYG